MRAVADRAGGLDAVFTAAGTDRCGTLAEVPGEEWDRVVLVNLIGTAAVVRAALPYLERTHGRVVTCASTLGLRALSDASAYCASKFGVVGFTRALAVETAGQRRRDHAGARRHAHRVLRRPGREVQAAGGREAQPARGRRRGRCCSRCGSRRAARCGSWW